jgi:hypothetical protein
LGHLLQMHYAPAPTNVRYVPNSDHSRHESELTLIPNRVTRAHLRRCGGLVTAVQAFDLTHVFDVIIPAQSQAT